LQNPGSLKEDILNNVRRETIKAVRKRKGIPKKIKLKSVKERIKCIIRFYIGIHDFKVYQPGTNLVADECGSLRADSHSIFSG
jgi:hypothetical protein